MLVPGTVQRGQQIGGEQPLAQLENGLNVLQLHFADFDVWRRRSRPFAGRF
jgi:hypothetical protein